MNKVPNFLKQIKSKSKLIAISFFGVAAIGTIILTSVNFTGISIITSAGSTALFPLMNDLANEYSKKEPSTELMIEAGGSGVGIQSIVKGSKQIGNVTRRIKKSEAGAPATDSNLIPYNGIDNLDKVKVKYYDSWEENKIKTITIAWDAIGIVYKPLNNDVNLDINETNIDKLFGVFSGLKPQKMSDLTGYLKDDVSLTNQSPILTPFSRTGGTVASGTATNFFENTNLNPTSASPDPEPSPDDIEVRRILKTGDYTGNVVATSESNVEAWRQFSLSGKDNTMIYLSSYFIFANQQYIEDAGFKIATYKKVDLKKENIPNTYNWFTSANAIISLKNIENSPLEKFIEWVIMPNPKDEIMFGKEIPHWIKLTPNQINSMKIGNNFWVTDFEIIKAVDDQNRGYGAIV